MDAQNPYATPRADLGQADLGAEGLAHAIAEFRQARGAMLGAAVALIVVSLVAMGSTLTALARIGSDTGSSFALPYLSMALAWLADLAAAVAIFWLRGQVAKLIHEPTAQRLTALLASLGRFWILATVLWCAPSLLGFGVSVVQLVLPAIGMAVVTMGDDPVRAASRLRTAVVAFLIAGGVLVLGKAALQLAGPLAVHYAPLKMFFFGSIIVQLALGFIVWLQVPSLDAFLASPTPANLTAAAAAQKKLWRHLFLFVIASFLLTWLGNFALGFMPG